MDPPNANIFLHIDKSILQSLNTYYSTKSTSVKIQFIIKAIEQNMPPIHKNISKSGTESVKYRNLGNEDYKNKKIASALKMYNLAIMNAPSNTKELCLAYSNRSAVNYTLKNYSACLEDIERAMALHCDTKLQEKLINRKMLCEKELPTSKADNIDDLCKKQFKLTKDQNATIPAASVSLELTYSVKMGRGVIATQDILPGEVLALEEPHSFIVLEPYYTEYCYGCLKQSDSMIPCPNCCSIMFCNEECRLEAFENYHKIDCKLIHILSRMKIGEGELMALRTVIQAKCTFGKCESLKKVIAEAESVKDPLLKGFSVDSSGKRVFDSSNYSPIHMMESNIKKRDNTEMCTIDVKSILLLHLLLNYSPFFDDCGLGDNADNKCLKEECIVFYGGLLLHNLMTIGTNTHAIRAVSTTECFGAKEFSTYTSAYANDGKFGGGLYAFLSKINHSCAPNVLRYNRGTSMALVALRPIKKGQQLFDSYGPHYAIMDAQERQKILMQYYKFQCECEACVNKWPLSDNLPDGRISRRELLQYVSPEDLQALLKFDRSTALKIVNKLCSSVNVFEKYAPCKEHNALQNIICQCLYLFGNIAPLRQIS